MPSENAETARPAASCPIVAIAGILAIGWLSACSDAAVSKAVGTGGDGKPPLVVTTSESAVRIENHTGRPLLDVRMSIEAENTPMPFVHVEPAIDVGVTREVPLSTFRDDDATLLDPHAVHLTRVTVTARDTAAKSYEATVPWMP